MQLTKVTEKKGWDERFRPCWWSQKNGWPWPWHSAFHVQDHLALRRCLCLNLQKGPFPHQHLPFREVFRCHQDPALDAMLLHMHHMLLSLRPQPQICVAHGTGRWGQELQKSWGIATEIQIGFSWDTCMYVYNIYIICLCMCIYIYIYTYLYYN